MNSTSVPSREPPSDGRNNCHFRLLAAAKNRDFTGMEQAMADGADPTVTDGRGDSVLHCLVRGISKMRGPLPYDEWQGRMIRIVTLVCQGGVDIMRAGAGGKPAIDRLMKSMSPGEAACAMAIALCKQDRTLCHWRDDDGVPLLCLAIGKDMVPLVGWLLGQGVCPNEAIFGCDEGTWNRIRSGQMLDLLLDAGLDPDRPLMHRNGPLPSLRDYMEGFSPPDERRGAWEKWMARERKGELDGVIEAGLLARRARL